MRRFHKLLIVTYCLLLVGCSTGFGSFFLRDGGQSVFVQVINLFDEGDEEENGKFPQLNGDWIFRRERLSFLDRLLRENEIDIFISQKSRRRNGSPIDDDAVILSAGAFTGYDRQVALYYGQENAIDQDLFLTALGPPNRFLPNDVLQQPKIKSALSDVEGLVAFSVAEIDRAPVIIANVDFRARPDLSLKERFTRFSVALEKLTAQESFCANRVIVGGRLSDMDDPRLLADFLKLHKLKDTAEDKCDEASSCYTLTRQNRLYASLAINPKDEISTRILVSEGARVRSAQLMFTRNFPVSDYVRLLGIEAINASTHYGWGAELVLPRCEPKSR